MTLLLAWPVWLSPWEWTADERAGVTVLIVVAGALVAAQQVLEARRLRQEQARPFVIADLVPYNPVFDLRIRNVGRTVARDIRFEFDPPLTSTHDNVGVRGPLMDMPIFKQGISSLAPDREIRVYFDHFGEHENKGLPMRYEATISYRGPGRKKYTHVTYIDLEMYRGSEGVTRYGLHDIHARLEEIRDALQKK